MKTKYIKYLVILFFLDSVLLFGQSTIPKIVPPTPLSMEFNKYIDFPVSHAIGLPEISIPLYKLSTQGIVIPISLDYHASGIKVEQPEGMAGYGWNVNPGYRISRTIYGKADETYSTDDIRSSSPDINYLIEMAMPASDGDGWGSKDGQFDIFTIQIPGYSGNFILKRVGNSFNVVNIQQNVLSIQVKMNLSYIYGFEVKDDKGIVYAFGSLGDTQSNNEFLETTNSRTTGWMLRKIEFPGQSNTIDFSYYVGVSIKPTTNQFDYYAIIWDRLFDSERSVARAIDFSELGIPSGLSMGNYAYIETFGNKSHMTYGMRIPNTISFANGRIVYSYSTLSSNGPPLAYYAGIQSLKVYDRNGNTIKNIEFIKENRLLKRLNISGEGSYHFEYNPQGFTNPLAQDWWGYYNGKNNRSLLPTLTLDVNSIEQSRITIGNADRNTDTTACKANILEKIIYPTGGYSIYRFQSNSFSSYSGRIFGGGLRIRAIETFDPVSQKTLIKRFKYGKNESGIGEGMVYERPEHTLVDEKYYHKVNYAPYRSCRKRTISSTPSTIQLSNGPIVWYKEVTEYSGEGKTVYHFTYNPDFISSYANSGMSHGKFILKGYYHMREIQPSLQKQIIYKQDESTRKYYAIKSIENIYEFYKAGSVEGLMVDNFSHVGISPNFTNIMWMHSIVTQNRPDPHEAFLYTSYHIYTGYKNLKKTIEKDFAENDSIIKTVDYGYDPNYPFNCISIKQNHSDGTMIEVKNDYVPNVISNLNAQQQGVQLNMKTNNLLTSLFQVQTLKNSSVISGKLIEYKYLDNKLFRPSVDYFGKNIQTLEPRVRYHKYDNYGNSACISYENGPMIIYIWGYKGQYPVAKIETTSKDSSFYTTVTNAIGTPDLNTLLGITKDPTDEQVRTIFKRLRDNGNLSGSMITSYTYKPLLGMTSETDPSGRTIFYEYDAFGRLKRAKDEEGKILQEYDYHYAQ